MANICVIAILIDDINLAVCEVTYMTMDSAQNVLSSATVPEN